jgi:hypothetical protein
MLIQLRNKVTDKAGCLNQKIDEQVEFWGNWLRRIMFFQKKLKFAVPPGQNSSFSRYKNKRHELKILSGGAIGRHLVRCLPNRLIL